MNNKSRKTIITLLMILMLGIIFFTYKKDNNVYIDEIDRTNTFAIMVEKGEGKYIEYASKEWPKVGYSYSHSKCVDKDRNDIGNLVTYNARENKAVMKTSKSAYCTLYFNIDRIAPIGNMHIGENNKTYTNNVNESIYVKVESEDAIEYCLTNEANSASCFSSKWKPIPALMDGLFVDTTYNLGNANGEKKVYLYIKDGARNISEVEEDSIILDTVKPTCNVTGGSTSWTKGNRTITWGCNDDRSGCKNATIGSREYDTTTKTTTLANYEIEDNAGNKENCNGLTANVYVDKTAPTNVTSNIRYDSASGEIKSNVNSFTDRTVWWGDFSATDSYSGVDHYEYNSGPNCNNSSTNRTLSTSGYTYDTDTDVDFCMRAVDKVGNISDWSKWYYIKVKKSKTCTKAYDGCPSGYVEETHYLNIITPACSATWRDYSCNCTGCTPHSNYSVDGSCVHYVYRSTCKGNGWTDNGSGCSKVVNANESCP